MKKRYSIEYPGTEGFLARLAKAVLPYEGNFNPIIRLLAQLQNPPLSCQTVLFEYDYVDKDYQDEFSAFYAKAFKRYPARCTRLHFFGGRIPLRVRLNLGRYRKVYLGFLIVRPTDLQRVGRTILRPTLTDHDHQFIHCQADFYAHILGERFTVRGMPFIQQDSQVGACAQASLWMVARYFSARFGLREYLPAQINQLAKATLALGRTLPAEHGLNEWQMLDALQGMGISALSYTLRELDDCSSFLDAAFPVDKPAPDNSNAATIAVQRSRQQTAKLADIAYRYIESGLPVILETNNHAFVAIGHTYTHAANVVAAIQRIPAFIVHNDNTGPYGELLLFPQTGKEPMTFQDVERIITVLPAEVSLRGEEAEARARKAFEELLKQEPQDKTQGATIGDLLLKRLRPELAPAFAQLEYRTYLILSTDFQKTLRDAIKARKFNRRLGTQMVLLDYPKYVWVTEVSNPSLLDKPGRTDRQCLGRVVIDSTAPAQTRSEIVVHCGDFVLFSDRNAETESSELDYFPNSSPFFHKV